MKMKRRSQIAPWVSSKSSLQFKKLSTLQRKELNISSRKNPLSVSLLSTEGVPLESKVRSRQGSPTPTFNKIKCRLKKFGAAQTQQALMLNEEQRKFVKKVFENGNFSEIGNI